MTPVGATDEAVREVERLGAELTRARAELRELNKIGMALMSERDPDRLLGLILTQARRLTASDAGSLYLVEDGEEGAQHLHFLRSQVDTFPDFPSALDITLPLDEASLAGYAALTGEPLVIDDAYDLPSDAPYSFNREAFDEKYGYRAKSMLVVPMVDHKGNVVGVLQLINRKSADEAKIHNEEDAQRWVLPYNELDVEVVSSLAGQAAVSIENGRLYQDIENLLEGFIKASGTAIDRRDPTTAGHSVRVTELTCDTAALMNGLTEGPFADVSFTEEELKQLRYAGLLHDFGKVAVPEATLVKVKKLPPVMGAQLAARFALIGRTLEANAAKAKVAVLQERGADGANADLDAIDAKLAEDLDLLSEYWEAVDEANVPRVMDEEASEVLERVARRTFLDHQGEEHSYVSPEELHFLSIKRGNLDENERKQIESHVIHSYDFLLDIPWTEELSRIAEIVRGHHEKLNGKGYPDGVTGEELSLETRIMTVCDIFDALTASDRPYKKAMPVEKALQILEWEAEEGALDADIVKLFKESGVYRKVLERDWREF